MRSRMREAGRSRLAPGDSLVIWRKQGADRISPNPLFQLAPGEGFEPPAKRLTAACSTTELPGIKGRSLLRRGGYSKAV